MQEALSREQCDVWVPRGELRHLRAVHHQQVPGAGHPRGAEGGGGPHADDRVTRLVARHGTRTNEGGEGQAYDARDVV